MDTVTDDEEKTDIQLTKVRLTSPMKKSTDSKELVLYMIFDTKED